MNVRFIENPDRELISSVVLGQRRNVPVRTNPLASDLCAELCEASNGRVRMSFFAGSRFCQGAGIVQGGVVAAMLDFAMAFAALSQLDFGESVATASLNINYLKPADAGRYQVEAAVDQSGRRVTFVHATLYRENQTIATATSTLLVVRQQGSVEE